MRKNFYTNFVLIGQLGLERIRVVSRAGLNGPNFEKSFRRNSGLKCGL